MLYRIHVIKLAVVPMLFIGSMAAYAPIGHADTQLNRCAPDCADVRGVPRSQWRSLSCLHAAEADTMTAHLYPNPELSVNASSYGLFQKPIDNSQATTSYRLDQTIPIAGQMSNHILTARGINGIRAKNLRLPSFSNAGNRQG